MWPRRIKSRSYRGPVNFAPLRGHSVTVNWSHSRNTKGTSGVSVPRWEAMSRSGESWGQQPVEPATNVPPETASLPFAAQKSGCPRSESELSTEVRSVVRNPLSKRCVSCVSSAVASRKRIPELWSREWRKSVSRSVGAYPPASPKDTLAGVFERMKRAARAKKFACISERLAPRSRYSEFQRSASPEMRERECVGRRRRVPCDA